MNLRLLLISHAATAAMRAGRFPADDPLDARALEEVQAARSRLPIADDATAFVSPALCARETSRALGLAARTDAALADIDYGNWRGRRLSELAKHAPDALAAWTRDPDAVPHGGESFAQVVKRIGNWLDALAVHVPLDSHDEPHVTADNASVGKRAVVAVTHAPVIRAAIVHVLGASPEIFSSIEIAPLAAVEMRHSRQRGWTWWPGSS
ncbi:histidine phosphatase family protein [Paraburkholderia phenoliruptrix]|uniref:histidine phosphatase family protein n=1 Tax=Paraburkholderia phenoliruptrix TaxID=252970 RepID=UPI001C6EA100|nr:histidine phosphatase family protein [Paraburkholderia phenoliruptrix]MBW9107538.1 histidine phosphatase family protein [Paraburkholderia phenoliruptrix]MBW9133414.1 histidine phosphatase family protein [Paraburkholderia ginsengiterrae]